jgi:transposase
MKQTSGPARKPAEAVIKDIRRATRRQFSAEEKIRIVLEGLRGEDSIAELCRREGIASSMYYGWSKEFLEAGKKRLAGDTARAATADEVKELRREAGALKEVVADLVLENRLLKKRMARPVCKVVGEGACVRSAQTYPACRRSGRRQDGEPHAPGLISTSASKSRFFCQASGTPLDRQAIFTVLPQTSWTRAGRS